MAANKNINLNVKTKGAKKAQQEFKKVGSSIQTMAAGFIGVGIAIAGVTRFLKDSVSKFQIQELAEKRLEVALGRTSKALLDQAAALQKSTSFADEEIIAGQALIAAFVTEEDAIKKATVATLDLAAAKGFDLKAAADLISKTLGSSTNALTRYGIQVEGAVGSTERLTSLTENIARAFGGQAAAAMETMSGEVENLSNSYGDLQEKVGGLINESIKTTDILNSTSDAFDKLGNIVDKISTPISKITGFFVSFVSTVGKILPILQPLIVGFNLLSKEEEKVAEVTDGSIDGLKNFWDITKDVTGATKEQMGAVEALWAAEQKRLRAVKEHVAAQRESFALETERLRLFKEARESGLATEPIVIFDQVALDTFDATFVRVREKINTLPDGVDDTSEAFVTMIRVMEKAGFMATDSLAFAFEEFFLHGELRMVTFAESFGRMLAQMAASMTANSLLFGGLSLLGLAPAGGLTKFLGFEHGGSFKVGGQGGPDSQVVAFRASPGEQVDITPQGQTNNNVTINFNGPISDKRYIQQVVIPEIQKSIRQGVA